MSIRDELRRLHRDDLDAFVQQYFPAAYRNFSGMMSNEEKIAILLRLEEDESIVMEALYHWSESRPGAARDRLVLLLPAPLGSVPTEGAAEANALRDALRRSSRGRVVDVHERSFVTVDSLRDVVAEVRPHAVHIATHGHGTAFEIQDGRGHKIELRAEGLADLMRQGTQAARRGPATPPRLLVLCACWSDQYAASLASLVDCAIGMKGMITPDAVLIFDSTFYKALGDGDSVAIAFQKGRTSVGVHEPTLRDSPTLYERIATIAERTHLPRRRH